MRTEKDVYLNQIEIDRYPINKSTLDLIDFIRDGGEVKPIKVYEKSKGKFVIRDGRHRFTAYKMMGKQKIKVKYFKKYK